MCKNALILVVTALLCLTSFSAEPIKVSNTNGNATNPRIAVMQTTSDIHIVWQEEGLTVTGLYFRRFNSEGVPQIPAIRFSDSGEKPVLAVGTDGNTRVAWINGTTPYFEILNPIGEITFGPIALESRSWAPSISIGQNDEANIIYEHRYLSNYYMIYSRFDATGELICSKVISNSDIVGDCRKAPVILSDNYGSSVFLFTDRYNWDRYVSVSMINPGVDDGECNLHDTQWLLCYPDRPTSFTIAFWPNDPQTVNYFWQEKVDDRNRILIPGCEPFDNSPANAEMPKATCGSNQITTIVWQDNRTGSWEIFKATKYPDDTPTEYGQITNSGSSSKNPDVATLNDKPVIVWQKLGDSGYEIYLQGDFPEPPAHWPVIIIPGIMGSELIDPVTNELVWLDPSKLPIRNDPWLLQLLLQEDGITPDPRYRCFNDFNRFCDPPGGCGIWQCVSGGRELEPRNPLNIPLVYTAYQNLADFLDDNGYTRDTDLFFYCYDWRLDLRSSAQGLRELIQNIAPPNGKVNIIAHSLGGLVARTYIKQNEADHKIDNLIFLGTPQLGSPWTFAILKGYKPLLGWFRETWPMNLNYWLELNTQTFVAQNFPTAYQLSPRYNFIKDEDSGVYEGYEASHQRLEDNNPFLWKQSGNEFFPLIDRLYPSNINYYSILGTGKMTLHSFVFRNESCIAPVVDLYADGTVPTISAISFGQDRYWFVNEEHTKLPQNEAAQYKILSILNGNPDEDVTGEILDEPIAGANKVWNQTACCPVSLTNIDIEGNITGLDSEGNIREEIPGSEFFQFPENDSIVVPYNGEYTLEIKGKGIGEFTLYLEVVNSDNITEQDIRYENIPVTSVSKGTINLAPDNNAPELLYDVDGNDSVDFVLLPGQDVPEELSNLFANRGDVNSDKQIDIADAISILSYLFASETPQCVPATDANDSGETDIADAIFLLSYLFADGAEPTGQVFCSFVH